MNAKEIQDYYKRVYKVVQNNEELSGLFNEKQSLIKPLYKYCSIDLNAPNYGYGLNNFENDILYFQDPQFFNDPFDSLLGVDFSYIYPDIINTYVRNNNLHITKEFLSLIKNTSKIINELNNNNDEAGISILNFLESQKIENINIPQSVVPKDKLYLTSILSKNKIFIKFFTKIMNGLITDNEISVIEKALTEFPPLTEYAHSQRIEKIKLIKNLSTGWKERRETLRILPSTGISWTVAELINWQIAAFNNWKFSDIEKVKSEIDNILLKYTQVLKDMLSNFFRIACLSERNDSILMWSHYSNKHTGFCLEYDFKQMKYTDFDEDDASLLLLFLFPVLYSNKRIYPPNDLFQQAKFKFYNENKKLKREAIILRGLLTKCKVWQYEKEWRFICPKESSTAIKMPYVSKVYLGTNINPEARKKLIEISSDKNIPVYQMYMDSGQFQLKSDLISH